MRTFIKSEMLNILETSDVGSEFIVNNGGWVIIEKIYYNRFNLYSRSIQNTDLARDLIYMYKNDKSRMICLSYLTIGDIGVLQLNYLEDIPHGQQMLCDLIPIIEEKIININNELYYYDMDKVKFNFDNNTTIKDINNIIDNVNDAIDKCNEKLTNNNLEYYKIKKLEEK